MSSPYTVHAAQSMREIDAAQWDACANPEADPNGLGMPAPGPGPTRDGDQPANEVERFNPFITHAFLTALETSKSVGSESAG